MLLTEAPRLVLPGRWGRIDLTTPEASRASIRAFVADALGRRDDDAGARAEYRRRLEATAEAARADHGRTLHVAIELTPGIPVPATLTILMPPLDDIRLDERGLQSVADLAGSLVGDDESAATTVTTLGPAIAGVRKVSSRTTGEQAGLAVLQVDYWLVAADPARLAVLSFSSPLVALQDMLVDLFDAIVATATWEAVPHPMA
jgi:hypothetical protein